MALRQNLNNLNLHIYWKTEMVLHRQLHWESSTLLEPAQFVFYKPNGKESGHWLWWWWWWLWCDDDNKDVNKPQFVHLQLHPKRTITWPETLALLETLAKYKLTAQLSYAIGVRTRNAFPLQQNTEVRWVRRSSLDAALGSALLLGWNRSSLAEKTYHSLC